MRTEQRSRTAGTWDGEAALADAQLVLVFALPDQLADPALWSELARRYPEARRVGCSTAGEIVGVRIHDDLMTTIAIALDHGRVEVAAVRVSDAPDSHAIGAALASRLPHAGLAHVVILSEGLQVNGTALARGLAGGLPAQVAVTGGLAADGERFQRTSVCLDGPEPANLVVAIGLYSPRLRIGYGSLSGWAAFGPERRITKAIGNVLHELDGEPALDLYKRYLGDHAVSLPASGLLFPLALRTADGDGAEVVRTVGGVDEAARTMTFVGEMPEGHRVRLMRASLERLVDGACDAARATLGRVPYGTAQLALLVSCVGRRLVLKQRIEEELEGVSDTLGGSPVIGGFYSYGELSPLAATSNCELHNQTMTITVFAEE